MKDNVLAEVGMSRDRNTADTLSYYDDLVAFFREDDTGDLMKLRSFSVYTPRQAISDFLARYELFRQIKDVQGSVLEFGVFNGQGLMSYAHFSSILEPNNLTREIVGFDTFEGFPDISDNDKRGDSALVKKGGLRADSYERLQRAIALSDRNRFLGHMPKTRLVKGDVLETLPKFLDESRHLLIALLYLDLDIYEPTKFVLENCLKRVPKGGIVAFDELNHRAFPGETAALLDVLDVGSVEIKRVPFCSRISYFVR
ncbi:MAG: class I SAM-dependent methyltransferase [Xanthobacteraceae bacterium]|nr:class I SAM-dependent methyltransferase [Xanthobacteraceae bacterium]QYK44513.1 MAG: class I SAM-dependent methyltransferase [Xanthobacteraceae bacterium]